ncbi:Uncharacterised protein [Salmonella enterica subsp. enterica serovar Bovismorbificans]|nr:Uncharacterised protein [Salmonella enterica subsp. enterica serovar Bovismorbificans]
MIIMGHSTVMTLKVPTRVIDHIALISLITQNSSSVIETSSIIPSPDKSPPQIRQNAPWVNTSKSGI